MATAKEIMDNIPPSLLDTPVEDIDIEMLAKEMTEWQELAPYLDLTPAEVREIAEDYAYRFRLQKREALMKWKEKHGRKATYRSLINIFCEQGRADLADMLKKILLTPKRKRAQSGALTSSRHLTGAMTDIFHDYLVDCYSSLPHPSSLQWPTTMTFNQTYVELNLLNVPVRDTDAKISSPIPLKFLFNAGNSKAKKKVILIEGVAGAGKTTLSWYAFKEWAEGRLFEDVKLLIRVDLGDPSIHTATKLSDLIPYPGEMMRIDIAKVITENYYGKGLCFWFDGCDEAPPKLWESFLYRFISGSGGRAMLPNAHIILTSRPGTSLMMSALTGKVIVTGFLSLDRYLQACSPDNGAQLIEALKMKPELYSLCHLPLHASILAYIYDSVKDDLPTTRTGLFYPLIQNFIVRHSLLRRPHQHPDVTDFPACLPDDIRSSFDKVTKLAFENVIHRKRFCDRKTLVRYGIDNEKLNDSLGFLRACVRFTMCGPTKQFSFTHLSFQEFLAAFHISQMDKDNQVVEIKKVFDHNPNSPVLAFYAGLTKLAVDKVREIYFKILSKSINAPFIVSELQLSESQERVNLARDPRRQLLCLMNGLYEAQNQRLFTYVNFDSFDKDTPDLIPKEVLGYSSYPKDVRIFISHMYLYPTDCLSVGYFTRHACSQINNTVHLDLTYAVIGEIEIKALMQEMKKPASNHNVHLDFNHVFLTTKSLTSLSTLFNPQSCLAGFETASIFLLDQQLALKYLVEGIARSNCILLTLIECSSKSLHYLILILVCRRLRRLSLSHSSDIFSKPKAMHLFSEALKYSAIQTLNLRSCHINDESLKLLAAAVCGENCQLIGLDINNNLYTEEGLTLLFTMLLNELPSRYPRILSVDHYNDNHKKLVDAINIGRYKKRFPPLVVRSLSKLTSQNKEIHDEYKGRKALLRPDLAFQDLY